jgi:cyclopropane fatty-acyl-phospholipid synthase-like methyltransferase
MVSNSPSYPKFNHDEYARSQAPDDFWGQIRRTVGGKPVADNQINMIVDAIKAGLEIREDDVLLDLACGNGALAHLFFDSCAGYVGVDFSEYLISVAKKNFEKPPDAVFTKQDVAAYVRREPKPKRFTKAVCYGSFSYFPDPDAVDVLRLLFERFSNIESFFIGNLPDRDRVEKFYTKRDPNQDELSDPCSQIGIWRSRDDFAKLTNKAGWHVEFLSMPMEFYGAHYRYDALLTRNPRK